MLTRKVTIPLLAGVVLLSLASHLREYWVFYELAQEKLLTGVEILLPLLLGGCGLIGLGTAMYLHFGRRALSRVLKPLFFLAVTYLGIQIVLSILMGGAAVLFHEGIGMSGEQVKRVVDMISSVLQIPLRAGAVVFFLRILRPKAVRFLPVYLKILPVLLIYAVLQSLLGLISPAGVWFLVRVIAASLLTISFLLMVSYVCKQEGRIYAS